MSDITVDPLFGPTDSAPTKPASPSLQPAPAAPTFAGAPAFPAASPATPVPAQPSSTGSPVATSLPTDADLDHLSQSVRGGYATVTEKLLATHKTDDAGEMGKGINELMLAAKGLSPDQIKNSGVLGRLFGKMRSEKEQILAHTQSVQKRIAELEVHLDQTAQLMRQRVTDIEGLKRENAAHGQQVLGGIQQVTAWQQQVVARLAPLATPSTPDEANEKRTLAHLNQRFSAALADLNNGKVLNQQQALELQATQDNGRAILEEFDRVKSIAIPALTSLVAQQLIALEQKQAMATDAAIRDMTQQAMLQAAKTLGENEIQVATLQQQSVISVDTLAQVQDLLDQSDQKVKEIQAQGEIKRKEDEAKRLDLERRLLS